jgi:hypothetical protein
VTFSDQTVAIHWTMKKMFTAAPEPSSKQRARYVRQMA